MKGSAMCRQKYHELCPKPAACICPCHRWTWGDAGRGAVMTVGALFALAMMYFIGW
jgi:hypothetical protein